MTEKPRVLVIDDEEVIRAAASRVLAGYDVSAAASGREGLRLLRRKPFDLVLTDLKMPDMDGVSVLRQAKEISPETEVIIITGYGTVKTAVEALQHGAYDFIEKPFTPESLLNVVERCLESRRLRIENLMLRREVHALYSLENVVGSSKAMQRVFELVATVAPTGSTVLLTGESGTGKEVIAKAIHYNSPRKDGPFVAVDCGTIPEALIESELFGHTRGSYTGAVTTEKGLVDLAGGGTVFFDEIGELPAPTQSRLLRLIQEKEFRPVGGRATVKADVRVIAATNRDLEAMVREGAFREDLFYRLNVFPIRVPPLRERKEDIPALTYHFLKKYSAETGKEVTHISLEAMKRLTAYGWPGNVRELENIVHRAVILSKGKTLGPSAIALPEPEGPAGEEVPMTSEELKERKKALRERSVEELERAFVLEALRRNGWNVTRAARQVGMQRTNFQALVRKYDLSRRKDG
ncbi:MAG: sigma-54 dependent transcriptional regulator [Thermodesulfovibrionales bacterium]